MFAQIGLGVDLGRLMLILIPIGVGFLAVVISVIFGALGLRALVRKTPASRPFRIAVAFFVGGIALIAIACCLRLA